MPDYKILISILAIVLTFVAYIPYILDTLKGKTIPHSFTWLVWSLASGITFGLQTTGGAGYGSWVALAVSVICFTIFIIGLFKKNKDITRTDFIFLFLSLVALYFWLIVEQPVWSVILIVTVDILGFIPTIRKSWNHPYSETLSTFKLNTFRHLLNIFALQRYSLLTWLSPVVWVFANGIFVIILMVRRKALSTIKITQ